MTTYSNQKTSTANTGAAVVATLWLCAALAACWLLIAATGAANDPLIDSAPPERCSTLENVPGEAEDASPPWVPRSRLIELDLEAFDDAALNAHEQPRITLSLFDDLDVTFEVKKAESLMAGCFTLVGAVPRGIGSNVTISVCNDAAYGVIVVPGIGVFEVGYAGDGVHRVNSIDPDLMPECGVGPKQIIAPPPVDRREEDFDPGSLSAGPLAIRVLVVYTPAARSQAGGTNGILAQVSTAMSQTNQALVNSQVNNVVMELADAREVSYVENNDMFVDIERLQSPSSGYMDEVHDWRVEECADLVALLSHNPNYIWCGLAYLPNQPIANDPAHFANWAFSVTWTACVPSYVFAHELGHNLGCHHDHANSGGSGSWPYSHGHRFFGNSNTQWRTVMAYLPGTRILNFSNPDVPHDGQPTGVPPGQPGEAHNALTILDNAGAVATYSDIIGGDCAEIIDCHWDGAIGQPGMSSIVWALTVFGDGSGADPALYAGGNFATAGGVTVNRVARWDGESWSALGSGMNLIVRALTVFDDGSGSSPALYAGGDFTTAGGVTVNHIARWDGESWSALGSGMNGSVRALTVFDDGSGTGPALYAGGGFTTAGGVSANRIARWDGESWSALGSGVNCCSVHALTVFDDGSGAGPALFAGGWFTTAGGEEANRMAKWDGESWSALGSGMNTDVFALTVFDDGSGPGPALYAVGAFFTAGGVWASRIARWDGESWSGLGSGVSATANTLTVFDDGSGAGPALYAGGAFTAAGGVIANRIARWDGESWSALGSGMNNTVHALTVFDDGSGSGPDLYTGGFFTMAGEQEANNIAAWGNCPTDPDCAGPADLNCDGSVGVADLLILLAAWGPCAVCNDCPADLDNDCNVGVSDLLILLANWG